MFSIINCDKIKNINKLETYMLISSNTHVLRIYLFSVKTRYIIVLNAILESSFQCRRGRIKNTRSKFCNLNLIQELPNFNFF